MKKIVLSLIVMLLCTAMAPKPTYHSGLKPEHVGKYNSKAEKLWSEMVEKKSLFQDPYFYDNFVAAVKFATQIDTLTYEGIMSTVTLGGAPDGFKKDSKNSSYMIARWSSDLKNVYWSTRSARPGEKFFWYGDICVFSVDCGNFMAPMNPGVNVTEDENGEDYCDIEEKQKTLSKRVSSGNGDVIVTINMHDFGNATATANANPVITNTLSAPVAPVGELGASNLNLGGGGRRFVVDNSINEDYIQQQPQPRRRLIETFGGQVLATTLGTASGILLEKGIQKIFGGGNNNNCYQQPIQRQCFPRPRPLPTPIQDYGPGFQWNNGGVRHVPVRSTNDPTGGPVQGGFTSVNRNTIYTGNSTNTTNTGANGGFGWRRR